MERSAKPSGPQSNAALAMGLFTSPRMHSAPEHLSRLYHFFTALCSEQSRVMNTVIIITNEVLRDQEGGTGVNMAI